MKSKDIRDKVRNTNRERYGGNAPMCSEHVKQKMRKTCEERYGGIGMASAELAQKTITKTIVIISFFIISLLSCFSHLTHNPPKLLKQVLQTGCLQLSQKQSASLFLW